MNIYLDKDDVSAIARNKVFEKPPKKTWAKILNWIFIAILGISTVIFAIVAISADEGESLDSFGIGILAVIGITFIASFGFDYYMGPFERKKRKEYLEYYEKNGQLNPAYPLVLRDVQSLAEQRRFDVPKIKSSLRTLLLALFFSGAALVFVSIVMITGETLFTNTIPFILFVVGVVELFVYKVLNKKCNKDMVKARSVFIENWKKNGGIPPRWEIKLKDSRLDRPN